MASLNDKSPFVDAVQKRMKESPSLEAHLLDGDLDMPLVIGFNIEGQPEPVLLNDLGK